MSLNDIQGRLHHASLGANAPWKILGGSFFAFLADFYAKLGGKFTKVGGGKSTLGLWASEISVTTPPPPPGRQYKREGKVH